MRILVKNHFESAVEALKANRARTLLTVVGVAVGTASITMILSLAGGLGDVFGKTNSEIKEPVAIVKSGSKKTGVNLFIESDDTTKANTLTESDASDISRVPNLKSAPIAFLHTNLKSKDGKIDNQHAALIGSTGSLKDVAKLEVGDGEFIDESNGVVVGHQLSIDLFGTENSIGSVITVRDQPLTVVGVLKSYKSEQYFGVDFNDAAIVPLSVIKRFTQGTPQIQQIAITADNHQSLNDGLGKVSEILSSNHNNDNDYRILSGDEINEDKNNMIRAFSTIMAIIGGISLLVGGIGIMNVMLVNVAERQREVGIRRAVGATGGHIINQFLIEAGIIGLIGGILGYLLGLGGAYLADLNLPFSLQIHWQTAVIAILTSVIIGILAGIYPAIRATRRDPIESLRY